MQGLSAKDNPYVTSPSTNAAHKSWIKQRSVTQSLKPDNNYSWSKHTKPVKSQHGDIRVYLHSLHYFKIELQLCCVTRIWGQGQSLRPGHIHEQLREV